MQAQQQEVEALGTKMYELAAKGDHEALAELLPSQERFAEYMEEMFSHPDILKKFEQFLNEEEGG